VRLKTVITLDNEDRACWKHLEEALCILSLNHRLDDQAIKVFSVIRANEFTMDEAEWAVSYIKFAAEERKRTAFEPTGICFVHGAEQEKGFQEALHWNGVRAIENADYFMECLLEDMKDARIERVRKPRPVLDKKKAIRA
jgi:hypothetical protein